jgi:hypothetical protein
LCALWVLPESQRVYEDRRWFYYADH